MSGGTIRSYEEAEEALYPGAFIECVHCGARYDRGDLEGIEEDEVLRCGECRLSGFIVHEPPDDQRGARRRMGNRFPKPLSNDWSPVPRALMHYAGDLGLGSRELLVVFALQSHEMGEGSVIRPSYKRIAGLTGLSESSVKRAVGKLKEAGLIEVERERRRGRWFTTQYSLLPLWTRLATMSTQER